MKVSNYDNYTIFCVHNEVMNFITSVLCNELHVSNIVSMLNSSRDACIDYHYCLSSDYKFNKYEELDIGKVEHKDFIDKYINKQG